MTRLSIRLMVMLLTTSGVATLEAGCSACKKDPPPPIDLGPPPATPDAGVVQLTPLDDAGADSGVDAGPGKPRGSWTPPNPNMARIKQCCNAIRHEAKNLGASPEATLMVGIAAQCDLMAAQVASNGTAPEFAQVRQMLKGRTIPAACSGM